MVDYKKADRYEKIDWLKGCLFPRHGIDDETCNKLAGILSMLAGQIPTDDFTKIYEYICLHWNIPKDINEHREINDDKETRHPRELESIN